MSSAILQSIEQRRSVRKVFAPVNDEPPRIAANNEDGGEVKPLLVAELPPPATPKDVADIAALYKISKAYMDSAKTKLENPPLPTNVDWELTLYMLFCAWIVNFGHDPNAPEEPEEDSKSKKTGVAVEYSKQLQHLIVDAATAIELEWVPFIDLALAPYSDHNKPASGPFGGVFVNRGPKPFMILAFKGTTYPMEVTTDLLAGAVKQDDDVLYGELAHKGMGQGLFKVFSYVGETKPAFEIIWEGLHAEAIKLKGTSERKVPLYVTGHSLGAGYGTLAYVELIRRLALTPSTSFSLYDTWVSGSPRVLLNDGVKKVKTILENPVRHFYRPAREFDIVPTIPYLIPRVYKHLDIGYKLSPDSKTGQFVTVRPSEIDKSPINDSPASWEYHWPDMYYKGIVKVLETQA